MAHSSLRPLLLLLEHAQEQRDQALAQRQRADVQLMQGRQQQAQLDDYRRDCDARWQGEFRQGVAVTVLQGYHEFVGRLQTAMQMHEQQVALMAAELKLASVRKLLERRQMALQQQAERAEQKQMDEMAARAGQYLGRGADSLHSD